MAINRLENGLIYPPTHLELLVADHCNITCRHCNHASPIMPPWLADPETVHRDFAIVAKYYRPKFIKILGGEPLLHPHLAAVIAAVRSTGISDHFTLDTNGTLLHLASDALWQAVDEVEISVYPGVPGTLRNIPLARRKAETFGKKLTIYQYEQFRATFATRGTSDAQLINNIYGACKIANLWGCHAIKEGFFHKCPQSIYVQMLTGKEAASDRLAIVDSPSFQEDLLAFVNSPEPLAACAHCVGTSGKQENCAQLPREHWRRHLDCTLEEQVDYDWLDRSLIIQDTLDDCKIATRSRIPRLVNRLPWLQRLLGYVVSPSSPILLGSRVRPPTRQTAAEARRLQELNGQQDNPDE